MLTLHSAGTEAPFLEFIQRVCAQCADKNGMCQPVRPGCGGFGIRNFLTLFLSIEVRVTDVTEGIDVRPLPLDRGA